jgi:hypothetical protein
LLLELTTTLLKVTLTFGNELFLGLTKEFEIMLTVAGVGEL